jgi:hypothetical protein
LKRQKEDIEVERRNEKIEKASRWEEFREKRLRAVDRYLVIRKKQKKVENLCIYVFLN